MPSLRDSLNCFIDTINNGPDRLDPSLFSGPKDRIYLGLKAHANTISHARIVALEQTFPLTRQHFGEAEFNRNAREFVELEQAKACDANQIGMRFADFLCDQTASQLARIEWAWLESYHAEDAAPMSLNDLAALDQGTLISLQVAPHPSVRLVAIHSPISTALPEFVGPEFAEPEFAEQCPHAILTLRPAAEVLLLPLNNAEMAVFDAATEKSATLGNLLAIATEQKLGAEPLGPIIKLIGAGALVVRE
jgi:hypothetical protein